MLRVLLEGEAKGSAEEEDVVVVGRAVTKADRMTTPRRLRKRIVAVIEVEECSR